MQSGVSFQGDTEASPPRMISGKRGREHSPVDSSAAGNNKGGSKKQKASRPLSLTAQGLVAETTRHDIRRAESMGDRRRRLIIALDQDNFYVAVERILNPDLCGKPVGITQKSLLATTSYEARAFGVEKLMSIRRAKEVCPGLILVDGEDLGKYRQYSTKVARLVNAILGAEEGNGKGVEKLGLDEIFFDVTDLVHQNVDELVSLVRDGGAVTPEHWFTLPAASGETVPTGFHYPLLTFPGHAHPTDALEGSGFNVAPAAPPIISPTTTLTLTDTFVARNMNLLALSAASHLCNHIRTQISIQTGLSSSGGIAHSKMLAKLIGNLHKPNDQTTFIEMSNLEEGAESRGRIGGSEMDRYIKEFLDPLAVRKINGFGSKTVAKITAALTAAECMAAPTESQDGTNAGEADPDAYEKLTVSGLRDKTSSAQLEGIFGARLGIRLWHLLHGRDDDPVHPSPDFPKQISVEDSYALDMRRTYAVITRQMLELTMLLLERLEEELVIGSTPSGKVTQPRQWVRYPSQFRLQIRREWEAPGGRDSKSTALPAFIFDLNKPLTERAELLHKRVSIGLLRDLLNINKAERDFDNKEYVVYVINVAVTNLELESPPPSLMESWGKAEKKALPAPFESVDLTSQRTQVAISLPSTLESAAEVVWEEELMEEERAFESGAGADNMATCGQCGGRVFDFAMVAHARHHNSPG